MLNLYVGNDNVLTITGLYDAVADTYVTTATVTFTITNDDATVITSGALSYINGTTGNYRGVIEDDVALVAGRGYTVTINVDAGSDLIATWTKHARAIART